MRAALGLLAWLCTASPVAAQGLSIPGFGGGAAETPQQKREFCQRVAGAAARCGIGLDVTALSACLVRSLPAQDSLRVAQVANSARGNAGALLSECGIGLGR